MKKHLLIIFIGICFIIPNLYSQNEHLEPVESIFDEYDFQFEYYSLVRKVLMNGMSDTPEFRFLIIPSFAVEEVVAVEEQSGKYFIVHHKMQNSIWYTENNKEKINVIKKVVEISESDMQLYHNLFKVAVDNRKPSEKIIIGIDGITYYFSAQNDKNYKTRTGMTWSPSEKSKIGKLKKVGHSLIELANNTTKGNVVVLNKDLKNQIAELTSELKK